MSEKEEILEDLKKNYTQPGHPIAFSGINNIYKFYEKRISKKEERKQTIPTLDIKKLQTDTKIQHINISKDINGKLI